MIRLAINGAAGRMGQRVIAVASRLGRFEIVSATEAPNHPQLGQDAGRVAGIDPLGIDLSSTFGGLPQVMIDYSTADGTRAALEYCGAMRVPLVVATTGLPDSLVRELETTAHRTPICLSPSFSLAVNVTMKLVEIASEVLAQNDEQVDVEIIERHHRHKVDSPSGTALRFGEIVARIMRQTEHVHGRQGVLGPRPAQQIGYHAIRAGDDPGQHVILFGLTGESFELRVAASNRDCYARGTLAAAEFLADHGPGLYSMRDVLNI
ncbi:MAG TPA: 4-hydroxy-tetrahydrodipicolinate reductase [Pirellulaceae bacterium]|nr:4-hydroxy-tetrahydrodipicolinate reductase [Pirellulaceae bacterium]